MSYKILFPKCNKHYFILRVIRLSPVLIEQVVSSHPHSKQMQGKGAAAPLKSRVCASLRSTPPISLRSGQALDFIHPAFLKAIIGLSPKALLFHYSFRQWAETAIFTDLTAFSQKPSP
jgi:hypothetical protein